MQKGLQGGRGTVTDDGGGLGAFDEGQGVVVCLLGHVHRALLQLVLAQDSLQLRKEPHPLVALVVAVGKDEDGGLLTGRGRHLRPRHLWE